MIYSEQQLKEIEEYASIFMKISDIASLVGVESEVLRTDILGRNIEVSKAYKLGKARSKTELHRQDMKMAKIGSPLAVENVYKNLLNMEDDE